MDRSIDTVFMSVMYVYSCPRIHILLPKVPMVCTTDQILDSITKMKHTLRFKKTWQDATKSGAPRMVGKLVYGVSPVPVSAALSVERREFYALFVEEAWLLIRDNLFEFDPDFSLVEHEQEGYGLTRSLRASSRRNILVMGQDQGICFEDVYNH
ncbi:hypothetical protein Bca52824_033267 [Brassica carinata]|uniref:Uncharacterized protein n=1 Tax=Brassica carinata TaxID=52824 RepID=A0A8X7SDW8_BRACI|nr:hypothetical protein Bca52824_033267 [Brassica carinata]